MTPCSPEKATLHKSGSVVLVREEMYWGFSFCGCFCRAISVGVFCKLRF